MKILSTLLCGLMLFSLSLSLPAEEIYDLDQLLALLKTNSLRLKISDLDRSIARAEYHSQRALPNPQLEYGTGKMDVPGLAPQPSIWSLGVSLDVPNPLYRCFFLKSMRNELTEANIQEDIKTKELIRDVKIHYYRLRFFSKSLAFLMEKNRILEEIHTITAAKVSIGEAKEIDALRTFVEIQKNKTDLFKVQKIVTYQKIKLREMLNNAIPADFTIPGDFTFTPLDNIEARTAVLLDHSPFILLKSNRLEAEKANSLATAFSIIDTFNVFYETEQEAEGKKWKVGVGISIPLFNQKSAERRKARWQQEKASLELDHEKKHFLAEMERIIADIRSLEKEIETFTGAVLLAGQENVTLAEKLYKEGEVPLVVFLDAQNSYVELQTRYYEAISEWYILNADLDALLGEK